VLTKKKHFQKRSFFAGLFVSLFLFFQKEKNQTQGLAHGRQVQYH
jgi:hypothetical protein